MTTRHNTLLKTLAETLTLAQSPTMPHVSPAHLIKFLYKAHILKTSLTHILRRTHRTNSRRTPSRLGHMS